MHGVEHPLHSRTVMPRHDTAPLLSIGDETEPIVLDTTQIHFRTRVPQRPLHAPANRAENARKVSEK